MKLYPTRLTFSDIQREEFSAKPIGRERRASRAIGREHDPRVQEIVGKVPDHERGGLP